VVGLGAAGACAAIEAAETGANVVVLDRFNGGGATALSGGVVYAGGGTYFQQDAGFQDSPGAMFNYLRTEVDDVVSNETLLKFCQESISMLDWLEDQGVPFDSSLCPYKTSYPTNDHYLYFSGSEQSFKDVAPPAPRGHRTHAKGTSGGHFYQKLLESVVRHGVTIKRQTTAQELITDNDGRVIGVECRTLTKTKLHSKLVRWSAKPLLYAPKIGRLLHKQVLRLEAKYGTTYRVRAREGVILAAGGFIQNREMMQEYAPGHRGGLRLGTPGDDGSGINMGASVGATTAHMDHISVWRFITPPAALTKGVLVGKDGRHVIDEGRYGAAIGEAIVSNHDGKAWLVVDKNILREARRQLNSQTLWFQRLQMWYLLLSARKSPGPIDREGLAATLKETEETKGLLEPYYLIDCSVRPRIGYPTPMLTLGGIVVDEQTGQAKRPDGLIVPGLYAAGRNAVGIASNSYVSGLSLADCVFSGRRAGRHAASKVEGATPFVYLEPEPDESLSELDEEVKWWRSI
jgi:3-oxo-5alpha-steroid 4-dehydrogenase